LLVGSASTEKEINLLIFILGLKYQNSSIARALYTKISITS